MRTLGVLLIVGGLILAGCSTAELPVEGVKYVDDVASIEAGDAGSLPRFGTEPGADEHDVLVVVLNVEYMQPLTFSLAVQDSKGTRYVWRHKCVPKGAALFETDPTPERQLEAGCIALIRVSGTHIDLVFSIEDGSTQTRTFELSGATHESLGIMCTRNELRFSQNGKPR